MYRRVKLSIQAMLFVALAYSTCTIADELQNTKNTVIDNKTQVTTLLCPDQQFEKGYQKQRLHIKQVDGKKAGTWVSGLRKTVSLTPGLRKIKLRHMFGIAYRDLDFQFTAEPGKTYHCTGRFENKESYYVEIVDSETSAVVATPITSTCTIYGGSCID
jgi:hypothetical protein